jgi:flagellar motor switch protein FliM
LSDVLSQSEIDALLNAMNSGEVDASKPAEPELKVKEYDFRTANRFSKEQIRTLHIIYDSFARLLSTYLSGSLRAMCNCEVVGVEELKYQEFVNALPTPVILAITRMNPLSGPTLVELSPSVAYSMIARLLGGISSGEMTRSFTEIELVLLERVIRQFIGLFAESWEKVARISAGLERIETAPQFAQIVALSETVVIITINIAIGESEGLMNVCLPYPSIEPISKNLNSKLWFQSVGSDTYKKPSAFNDISQRIHATPLPVAALFNSTFASVRDIINLQVGDVVQLDHSVRDPLTVRVGHLPKFRASLGLKDGRYAVKIAEVIREEDADNE